MTTPPWGHKPPRVPDIERYWSNPPPEPSDRCAYWVRRYNEGSWIPNKHQRRCGYYSAAERLGIYLWEYLNVIRPLESHYEREVLGRPRRVPVDYYSRVVGVIGPGRGTITWTPDAPWVGPIKGVSVEDYLRTDAKGQRP